MFKQITMGHPIIMGRKTHESIGRALPGRQNIVITRDKSYQAPGCDVVNSLDEALELTKAANEAFIIGGAAIYELALPKVDKIYLTQIKANIDGDKHFKFKQDDWKKISSVGHPADDKNQYSYEFQQWVRK